MAWWLNVWLQTRDQGVVGSTRGRFVIKWLLIGPIHLATTNQQSSTQINSAFHPYGVGKSIIQTCLARLWRGAFTCVNCDLIGQVTLRSSAMVFP